MLQEILLGEEKTYVNGSIKDFGKDGSEEIEERNYHIR